MMTTEPVTVEITNCGYIARAGESDGEWHFVEHTETVVFDHHDQEGESYTLAEPPQEVLDAVSQMSGKPVVVRE